MMIDDLKARYDADMNKNRGKEYIDLSSKDIDPVYRDAWEMTRSRPGITSRKSTARRPASRSVGT